MTLIALLFAPGEASPDQASTPLTMAFAVMALGTVFSGLVMRRDPESGLDAPIGQALRNLAIPLLLTGVAAEWTFMQRILPTTSLTGGQWLGVAAVQAPVCV